MRGLLVFLAYAASCHAWDTPPHRQITQAALETLPARFRAQLGPEAANLVEFHCMLPDRYVELERFGFRRNSPGPRDLSEMEVYCVRPDGEALHSATWDRDEDLASLVYVFERIISSLSAKQEADAARYMGTLAHFLEDSLSPPHAVSAEKLRAMAPAGQQGLRLHSALERAVPAFDLGPRAPHPAGPGIVSAAEATLERLYAAADQNRKSLPGLVRAVCSGNQAEVDGCRLRAGRAAAELLADTLYTLFAIAST